ncbi:myelin and lymphocyte protein isoform X2 [Centrocercus urophasianus]|uniref:myelin and lymphocyte protein isoform X2 n=1 Tax=Centrocercus urophasianus TaxID=9002 RepID=UPI001C64EE19|nr:myelin and lymphocyte protein isoform X2 [Centrocercus urophasianus]
MRESFTMSSATSRSSLPSGLSVFTTFPDVLFIPEMIFGGLVWILIASSKVPKDSLQGWDVICQETAALFYFSASVLEAIATKKMQAEILFYRENISASVFAFIATLLYVIHIIYSLRRWKSS